MEMRINAESAFATSSAFISAEILGLIWEFRLRILDLWDRCALSFDISYLIPTTRNAEP